MERRTFIRTVGAAGVASAVGIGAFATGGAASSAQIQANEAALSNDDGDVRQVLIDPQLEVRWADLDDAVGAVSIFVEARAEGDEEFAPIARAEPPLYPNTAGRVDASKPGTTGRYVMEAPVSEIGGNLRRTAGGLTWQTAADNGGLIVADAEHGRPDYDAAAAGRGYLQGSNVFSGTVPDLDSIVNAEYGAAAGTDAFDVPTDGTTESHNVELRYTIQLVQLGLQHIEGITGFDPVAYTENGTIGEVRDLLDEMYDASNSTWSHPDSESTLNNADFLSEVTPDDVTVVAVTDAGDATTDPSEPITWERNQKRPVMMGDEYAYPSSGPLSESPTTRDNKAARDYLDNNPDYPGFIAQSPSFPVTVTNEEASTDDQTTGGNTNTQAR